MRGAWPGSPLTAAVGRLTIPAIKAHAAELKKQFLPPIPNEADILRFDTRQYFESNGRTQRTAHRELKVVLSVQLDDLRLSELEREKLCAIVGPRQRDGTLRLVGRRFPNAQQNKEYLKQLLVAIVTEARAHAAAQAVAPADEAAAVEGS